MKSEPRPLWQDTFLRMKNAAPMALFGDHRTYLYGGKPVGESLHIGVDLASLVHAPIEAANNGIVRFTGMLGIYGNTVIIDHGMGLSTLYAHMSGIQVKPDQNVKRGRSSACPVRPVLPAGIISTSAWRSTASSSIRANGGIPTGSPTM